MLKKNVLMGIAVMTTSLLALSSNAQASALVDSAAFYPGNGLPDSIIADCPYWEDPAVADFGYSWYGAETRYRYDIVPDANIGYHLATSKTDARVRVYVYDYGDAVGWWGHTEPHAVDGRDMGTGDAWYYVDIKYNDGKMNRDGFTSTNKLYNTLHEWGHALSMAHQDDSTVISVMVQGKGTLSQPAFLDKQNLAYQY